MDTFKELQFPKRQVTSLEQNINGEWKWHCYVIKTHREILEWASRLASENPEEFRLVDTTEEIRG